jgi:hypothetical protein
MRGASGLVLSPLVHLAAVLVASVALGAQAGSGGGRPG